MKNIVVKQMVSKNTTVCAVNLGKLKVNNKVKSKQ